MEGLIKNKFASLHYICYHIYTNLIIPIKQKTKITLKILRTKKIKVEISAPNFCSNAEADILNISIHLRVSTRAFSSAINRRFEDRINCPEKRR